MRIWSVHPENLDTKGLVALWRESLLAKKVLEEKTKGYRNHPQLIRFRKTDNPLNFINQYLSVVYQEAERRGFLFNKDKINWNFKAGRIPVTNGQIEFEKDHLLKKLKIRDFNKYKQQRTIENWNIHPIFDVIDGRVEEWERY